MFHGKSSFSTSLNPLNMPAPETRSRYSKLRSCALFFLLIFCSIVLLLRLYSIRYVDMRYVRILHYEMERNNIMNYESYNRFGNRIKLTMCEEKANEQLMFLKWLEYQKWEVNGTNVSLGDRFSKARDDIERSLLYKVLRKMPKGAALHVHDVGLTSVDFIVKCLTYYQNLWVCVARNKQLREFRFSQKFLNETNTTNMCTWYPIKEWRRMHGAKVVDAKIRDNLIITTTDHKLVAARLKEIKSLLKGLISYAPVWEIYFEQAFKEFIEDGVQYIEIRTILPRLYNLSGHSLPHLETLAALKRASETVAFYNASFVGAKVIYTPSRNVNDNEVEMLLSDALILKLVFKDYVAGLDLISDDYFSKPLRDFSARLIYMQDSMDFYFTVDDVYANQLDNEENLIDAYLLGSKRLPFSYPLMQHPYILRQIHRLNIGLVINPISIEYMQNLGNSRFHPASILFTFNLPLIISSDYPRLWQASPITHDFYVTFMKIAPRESDLRVLKQLARNSIVHSAKSEAERDVALRVWEIMWSKWICELKNMNL
uniref:Adenosine deaminase n=1 Tax=Glossina pallidipes TaxID=7398 RepID=A0A1A9ZTP8_GLOPL